MNHRERVLTAYAHREPDRVPRYAGLTPGVMDEFRRRTGQDNPAPIGIGTSATSAFAAPTRCPTSRRVLGAIIQGRDVEWMLDWDQSDYPPEWGVATRSAHFYHLSAPLAPMLSLTTRGRAAGRFPSPTM